MGLSNPFDDLFSDGDEGQAWDCGQTQLEHWEAPDLSSPEALAEYMKAQHRAMYPKREKKAKRKSPEAEVAGQALAYLKSVGAIATRVNSGQWKVKAPSGQEYWIHGADEGTSDYLVILPGGRFLALETKRAKGGQRKTSQKAFLASVEALGGLGVFCADVDADLKPVVEAELKRVGRL